MPRVTRSPRTRAARGVPRGRLLWAAGIAAALGVGGVIVAIVAMQSTPAKAKVTPAETPPVTASTLATGSVDTSIAAGMVEVPSLVGDSRTDAELVLQAAGLSIAVRETADSTATAGTIVAQDPQPGTVSAVGSTVTLTVSKPGAAAAARGGRPAKKVVVCIDPGHQAHSDPNPEPIGPGASETKPRVTGGATGVSTDIPESEIALQIAMNLKKRLEAAGVKVVMTRTTNDVSVSNAERAQIANQAKADLFVRIHGDGNPDRTVSGISTLYPQSNKWTKPIAKTSRRAAEKVQAAVVARTGAVDRGAKARSDLSGFNWCKVPAVLVECGFLSNPVEDKLLASPHYQDKVAQGIADGVLAYTGERR